MLFLAEWLDESGAWQSFTVLNTALMETIPDILREVVEEVDGYRSAGVVHSIAVDGHDVLPELLDIPEVLTAARRLALSQMRKGRAAFARFHNDALADAIFTRLDSAQQAQ